MCIKLTHARTHARTHAHTHTHTHRRTHTEAPAHTSILTIQSSKRPGDLEWMKTQGTDNMAGLQFWEKKCSEIRFEWVQRGFLSERKGKVIVIYLFTYDALIQKINPIRTMFRSCDVFCLHLMYFTGKLDSMRTVSFGSCDLIFFLSYT